MIMKSERAIVRVGGLFAAKVPPFDVQAPDRQRHDQQKRNQGLEPFLKLARPKGMCCFSTATVVHGTNIFARLNKRGTQVLAYQMTYASPTPTAMILPLPVALPARADSVRFIDLKGYADFFADLGRGFPALPSNSIFRSKSAAVAASADLLEVHDVGDFVASFVPSVADFGRVDPRFVISKDVWSKIPAYKDYGFAVFQLKELSGAPHPIAFEFDTRLDQRIFFPTVHIHDGTVHEKDDFDHALYLQAPAFDARVSDYDGPDAIDKHTGYVRSDAKSTSFTDVSRSLGLLDADLLVHKLTMRGSFLNQDTFCDFKAVASTGGGCGRCDAGAGAITSAWLPAGLTMAGFAWLVRRRNALLGKSK